VKEAQRCGQIIARGCYAAAPLDLESDATLPGTTNKHCTKLTGVSTATGHVTAQSRQWFNQSMTILSSVRHIRLTEYHHGR